MPATEPKYAVSKSQQRLMGMVDAYKDGKLDIKKLPKDLQAKIIKIAKGGPGKEVERTKGIKAVDSHAMASTKHKGLPERVKENVYIKDFETFLNEAKFDINDFKNTIKNDVVTLTNTIIKSFIGYNMGYKS